jgi:hypothetical protein
MFRLAKERRLRFPPCGARLSPTQESLAADQSWDRLNDPSVGYRFQPAKLRKDKAASAVRLSSRGYRRQNPDSSHHSFDKPLTSISDILIRFT